MGAKLKKSTTQALDDLNEYVGPTINKVGDFIGSTFTSGKEKTSQGLDKAKDSTNYAIDKSKESLSATAASAQKRISEVDMESIKSGTAKVADSTKAAFVSGFSYMSSYFGGKKQEPEPEKEEEEEEEQEGSDLKAFENNDITIEESKNVDEPQEKAT